ncbi:MAG: P27 family phage terminase small subunit [Methanobrevibacter sp.]|nr:P27 family phage terminase small subunit [Methanobrevibacter sp.]
MGGRPPKIIKTGAYTKETKKAFEDSTPIYQSQNFIPPADLSEKELAIWNEKTAQLRETYNCMVSDLDLDLIRFYCQAKVKADEAYAELKKDPRPYILVPLGVDKNGKPKTTAKANPNLKKYHDNALLCLKYMNELGLSPLARARAGVKGANAKEEENVFLKFMNRSDDD